MSMLLRKQILISPEEDLYIKHLAQTLNLSYSQTIRHLVKKTANSSKGDFLGELSKLKISGGPKDLSSKIDWYLYQ